MPALLRGAWLHRRRRLYTMPTPAPSWTDPASTPPSRPLTRSKPAVVVLHDVDRLGREIIVQAIAERDLTRHGARIEYVLGGGNATPEQELLKMVKQGIAVYENRQRVERSRRGKDGRVRAGHVLVAARPAYGYRYVGGKRTGTLEPDPDEAPIVRQIFAWCADEGLTTYEIAKRLCAEGVPTRADTNPSVVHKVTDRHFWDPTDRCPHPAQRDVQGRLALEQDPRV